MDSNLMVHLPPELKIKISSHVDTPAALSRLGQCCRAWYEIANEELYKRDARENVSFAMKWMAAHAVDERTTDLALRALEVSRRWGGQIDAVLPQTDEEQIGQITYESLTALSIAVAMGNMRLAETLLDLGARHDVPCSGSVMKLVHPPSVYWMRRVYFQGTIAEFFILSVRLVLYFPIFVAFMHDDSHMCRLLLERGVGCDAVMVINRGNPERISILHFAAADFTEDYDQWRFLYDTFREHINERCGDGGVTPLHISISKGCNQGVYNALEAGADTEARNNDMETPNMVAMEGYEILDV